jgi:hypothetical protein
MASAMREWPSPFPFPMHSRLRTILSSAALALAALLGWAAGHVLSHPFERQSMERAQAIAARFAERIDMAVWAGVQELRAFAASPSLSEPELRALHARPTLDAILRALPAFQWVAIADTDGVLVSASGGEGEGSSVVGYTAYREARLAQRHPDARDAVMVPRIGTAAAGSPSQRFLDLSVATFDETGRHSGVLLATLGWDWALEPAVAKQGGAAGPGTGIGGPGPARGELMVVGADGTVLLSTDPAMAGRMVDTRLDADTPRGMLSSSTRRWPDGERYQTVAAPSPGYRDFTGLGWTVVWRQPVDEAQAWRHLPMLAALAAALLCGIGLALGGRLR